ncbi:MAG: hypothetical protein WC384_10140 [Prolixibacteraceae bacterium]|jgi:hypothetical protein
MRPFALIIFVLVSLHCYAQLPGEVLFSGIILNADSLPVPDVAIIDLKTGKTIRTNSTGFFQTVINPEDSLMVYHISYKKQFINADDNAKLTILQPEIQEIMQVDITDNHAKEQQNLQQTVDEINRLASMKKLTGYELHSTQEYFVRDNGSHTKGFTPFFGPTVPVSFGALAAQFSKIKEKRELKKLTEHYHLVKNDDRDEKNK